MAIQVRLSIVQLTMLLATLGSTNSYRTSISSFLRPPRPNNNNGRNGTRIYGGEPAQENEYPHQVSLRFVGNHRCGGSIIGASYVLTAAHCVVDTPPTALTILAGAINIFVPGARAQTRNIAKYTIHSKYNPAGKEYDIAILVLDKPLELNAAVRTIALPNFGFEVASSPRRVITTGWGMREMGFTSDVLMAVKLPVVPHRACEEAYVVSVDESLIKDTMICAGSVGKDTCQGDSGGPLTLDYGYWEDGRVARLLVGVTAFGEDCGKDGFPGVYTKVASFREWIADITGL